VSRGRGLELCLLAPAFAASGLEYVASDVDRGIQRALDRLDRSLSEMGWLQVVAARGEVGEADPMLAIDSALELFERVCRRFELPVWEIELNEDEGGITHAVQVAHSPVALALVGSPS
jgi:hypothetical protein